MNADYRLEFPADPIGNVIEGYVAAFAATKVRGGRIVDAHFIERVQMESGVTVDVEGRLHNGSVRLPAHVPASVYNRVKRDILRLVRMGNSEARQ